MGFFGTTAGQGVIANGINSLFGIGTSLVGNKQQQDLAREQANTQREIAQSNLEIERIRQQTELAKLNAMTSGGSGNKNNLPLYIGLGVGGVVVLGLVIFAVTRNR